MSNEKIEETDGSLGGCTRLTKECRQDIIQQYKLLRGDSIMHEIGFYYGTVEVPSVEAS